MISLLKVKLKMQQTNECETHIKTHRPKKVFDERTNENEEKKTLNQKKR